MKTDAIHGPQQNTPEWLEARMNHIAASEAAAACAVRGAYRQPRHVYDEKLGLVPPFEGNDFTRRGHRFQPFLVQEFEERFETKLESDLPMLIHPEFRYVSASLDAVEVATNRPVELKCCNWRRASQLGEEDTDEVFPDWLVQVQQQMFVYGADEAILFVMVDLHTYRRFVIQRNDDLIGQIVRLEGELWQRIIDRDPPPVIVDHPSTPGLLKNVDVEDRTIVADEELSLLAAEFANVKLDYSDAEKRKDVLRSEILTRMGTASVCVLPGTGMELVRKAVTVKEHIVKASTQIRLTERKSKNVD